MYKSAPTSISYQLPSRQALLAAGLMLGCLGPASAAPDTVSLPGPHAYPESLTATLNGTLFVGSFAQGGVYRASPGATEAEVWVKPGAYRSRSTLGVLADEKSNTLWVCSNDNSGFGVPGPGSATGSALIAFDLTTGEGRRSIKLPGAPTLCNDLVIAPDGTAYVTDSFNPHTLIVKPGATEFEVWATDPRFGPPKNEAGLDGIAIGSDSAVYADTYSFNYLFKIDVSDGRPGTVTEMQTSQKITLPDALHAYGANSFLLVEGSGSLDLVTVNGEKATIKVLKDGFSTPVSVTQVGGTAWVAEGQLPHLLDPKLKDEPPKLPFKLYAVPLPAD